eukprot:3159669-Pyramimonas_sp.AAC.1
MMRATFTRMESGSLSCKQLDGRLAASSKSWHSLEWRAHGPCEGGRWKAHSACHDVLSRRGAHTYHFCR